MAKKKKQLTKINQRIRRYFDDDPFDVGIERVDTQTLSELFGALGIVDIEHNKTLMVKTLRMIWSEADGGMRRDILTFFENDGRIFRSDKPKELSFDRETKIEALLEELDATSKEAAALREFFASQRSKKITINKMESKLQHLRFEAKKQQIETACEGLFDLEDRFEFNASIAYKIFDQYFHKIVVLHTKPYDFTYLQEADAEEIIQKIQADKMECIAKKQQEVTSFLHSLKDPHPYLRRKEIVDALRAMAPNAATRYPLIAKKTLHKIVQQKVDAKEIFLHTQELVLVLIEAFSFPKSEVKLPYTLELSVDLDSLLEEIWKGKRFDFEAIKQQAKEEVEGSFLQELERLVRECGEYAELLHWPEEVLREKVYSFVFDLIPSSLVLSSKVYRKVSRRFLYSIQEELAKKQREALLARTIRDFKNLFPIARGMGRKLVLHIGPTNSGKTYTAMQKLQNADTGYYLAPLRLLALEGYETMRKEGLEASLITGEEQIIDEEATHISSTIEMMNYDVDVDVCVIDEVQMINERERGWAWANAIIGAPAKEVIMTGSANVKEAIITLAEYLGEELEIIEFERKNPLKLLEHATDMHNIQKATAVIAFSRKDVLKLKQTLSKNFSVSVVYGNLSPEVRREEARRFREGESDIIVATDAIAMGMNLPIQTVLFSKAKKFDGIMERNLQSSEILQIAGRAGRYGLHENGYVGALNKETLKIISKGFYQEPKKIMPPFKVMASLEHIKLVASILEENALEHILSFFVQNMEFDGPFYAASLEDMLEASKIIDTYDLDIATKYHLACAPLTLKSPYIIQAYEGYIQALEKKEHVHYHPPKLSGAYAQTSKELLLAEDMVKEISLYLWLSYRFGEYFVDEQKARTYRGVLNAYIERSLHETQLARSCRLCGVALPLQSRYSICQKCFRKNYTYKGRKR